MTDAPLTTPPATPRTLPDPPVLEACDLRNFPDMPLEVASLRDSALRRCSTGDEFKAAVLLWSASWHQVPAGSLPDDDVELADLAGIGTGKAAVRAWLKVKPMALRGWYKCNDDKLYHPLMAQKASKAWSAKLAQRERTAKARLASLTKALSQEADPVRRATLQAEYDRLSQELSHTLSQGQSLPMSQGMSQPPREGKGSEGIGSDRKGSDRSSGGSGTPPASPPPPAPPHGSSLDPSLGQVRNLADLRLVHPRFTPLGADDHERAKRLLGLYGADAASAALRALEPIAAGRPANRQRILVSEWADWLTTHVKLAREDYLREGLPIPDGTPSQAELDGRT